MERKQRCTEAELQVGIKHTKLQSSRCLTDKKKQRNPQKNSPIFLCNQKCAFAASESCYLSLSGNCPWIRREEKSSSSRIKMHRHAYTNNNYCFQEREEAKQTNVKGGTAYWATSKPFSETGEGGSGGKRRLPVPPGIMNHLFVSHRIFVITCEQISPGGWNADLFALFHYAERKKKNKEKNAFLQRVRSRENKFWLFLFLCRCSIFCHVDAFN